jgi:hypothetical protein
MNYEFLGGNLALDFANTVHSHGMVDPCDDLIRGGSRQVGGPVYITIRCA